MESAVKVGLQNEEVVGASDVGRCLLTVPTGVATKPSHFYCCICHKDIFVPTYEYHEILGHFEGRKHFPRPTFEVGDVKLGGVGL